MMWPNQRPLKIRKIESYHVKPTDIVGRLRATWFGRLYVSHLKQYIVIRWITTWIWSSGYPVYVNHIAQFLSSPESKKEKQWRRLITLSEWAEENHLLTYPLVDTVLVETPGPKVFPVCDQGYLASPLDHFNFPAIYIATINEATTYGGTNLILTGDVVVSHDLYDFERDSTSEELHGRTLIDSKTKRIRWLLHDKAPESISVAATFVDACASNYAHWMTEVLPRIVLFCAEGRFLGMPIVVNDGLHKNMMESLLLVVGSDREIITLPIGRALVVNKLYLTSATGYVPFGRRTNTFSDNSDGLFSSKPLEVLRHHLSGLEAGGERKAWPERIYLRRNSGTRLLVNASEIEELLFANGYVIVEPEKMSFWQQIQLFSHAKEIVSPTGAALANAIACKPGAQVAILMGKHKDMIYGYWSNLLGPFGIKVSYVLGNIVANRDLGIHGDFAVDMACIDELLESFKEK